MEDEEEVLDTTNETENVDTETTEENQEEVNSEAAETENVEEKEEKKLELTQEQLDDMIQERVKRERKSSKRNEANITREYEEKLAKIESVINAGFGTNNLDEGLSRITDLCNQKGIKIPEVKRSYSNSDIEVLANHTANEIIDDGYDAIKAELNNLNYKKSKGNLNQRDEMVLQRLNTELKTMDNQRELEALGVKPDLLNSSEFKEFANKFEGSKFTMREIYEMYNKPKPKAKPIGSMVNPNPKGNKDFITEAEYDKMSPDEIDKNMELIRKSMLSW